jgi:hypothetical protein
MEEQEVGGQQILRSIARLREITVSVQKGSENMSQSGYHFSNLQILTNYYRRC